MTVSKSTTPDSFAPLYVNSYQVTETSLKLGHGIHFHDIGGGVYRGTGCQQFVAGDADPTTLDLKDVTFG